MFNDCLFDFCSTCADCLTITITLTLTLTDRPTVGAVLTLMLGYRSLEKIVSRILHTTPSNLCYISWSKSPKLTYNLMKTLQLLGDFVHPDPLTNPISLNPISVAAIVYFCDPPSWKHGHPTGRPNCKSQNRHCYQQYRVVSYSVLTGVLAHDTIWPWDSRPPLW